MTDTSRYSFLMGVCAWGALAALLAGGWLLREGVAGLPDVPTRVTGHAVGLPAPVRTTVPIGLDWAVFQGGGTPPPVTSGLGQRFRLAGTFFVTDAGGLDIRKAVLDVISIGEQRIVVEGDRLEDVVIIRISRDRVVLRCGAGEETLWLSFSDGAVAGAAAVGDTAGMGTPGAGPRGRFGQQVADNNWVFDRAALMAYYNALWDEPERMLQVFDSLKPLYDGDRNITGYQVGIEGERDFFDAVGFREGDVVRKVNSVAMTNRGRAENFIAQFAQNRMNVFVVDIERNGKPARLVYRIR